jgi:hypothetical protein
MVEDERQRQRRVRNHWQAPYHECLAVATVKVPDRVLDGCVVNTGQHGGVANQLGVWVGGQFTPRSMMLKVGETYEFRVLLKARRPGHWHTHVQLSCETGGPIPGPGQYIYIKEATTQKQPTDRTVQIYYATNRAAAQSRIRTNYTGDRADKLSFGIMQVRVPENHHTGVVEYDRSFDNIQLELDYMKHNFVVSGINPLKRDQLI